MTLLMAKPATQLDERLPKHLQQLAAFWALSLLLPHKLCLHAASPAAVCLARA